MKRNIVRELAMVISVSLLIGLVLNTGTFAANSAKPAPGKYVTGDFHNHTYLTDGNKAESEVVKNAFEKYGLDWMANSEHGGTSKRDPLGSQFTNPAGSELKGADGNPITYALWRWIMLRDYSYPVLQNLQKQYPGKVLIQALEWNVPSHEHASVGIIADSAKPISDFEYIFDQGDLDTSRAVENLPKINKTHADAVAGAKWLETNYKNSSYYILNHPSRKLKFSVSDIRDMNNAAPDVFFGMEGFPGHQKESARGGYGSFSSDPTDTKKYNKDVEKARTYGGADYMTAKVGGLWDSLLGEGRHFWAFVNSDFHDNEGGDFWPGEYAKSYTYVTESKANAIVNGMRSGNSFAVQGDLINALDFKAGTTTGNSSADMGQTLELKKNNTLKITIRFKSPAVNNNKDSVKVDHIDLIAGNVTAKVAPGTDAYKKDTNDSTKVIKTFTSKDWKVVNGWNEVSYEMKNVNANMYFRLRGTNLGFNVENQTDAQGNPLNDDLIGKNDAAKAYADLWFYSNPIFVSSSK